MINRLWHRYLKFIRNINHLSQALWQDLVQWRTWYCWDTFIHINAKTLSWCFHKPLQTLIFLSLDCDVRCPTKVIRYNMSEEYPPMFLSFNSFWHCNAFLHHDSGPRNDLSLVYHQAWIIVNYCQSDLKNKLSLSLKHIKLSIQQDAFKNVACEMSLILSRS